MEFNPTKLSITLKLASCLMVVCVLWELLKWWKNRKEYAFMWTIPGPLSLPIIGSSYVLFSLKTRDISNYIRVFKSWPGVAKYWIGYVPYITVSNRQIVNAILSSSQAINKTADYKWFHFHTNGIFVTNGSRWRVSRKRINSSYQTKILASFGNIFHHHLKTLLQKLNNKADGKITFDIFGSVHMCTIDFICETMLGCRMNVQKRNISDLSTNLSRSTSMILSRSANPLLWPDIIYKITGMEKELINLVHGMRTLSKEIVKRRREHNAELQKSRVTIESDDLILVDNLLRQAELGNMTLDSVTEEVVDTFIGGSITTATTNSWVFFLLGMYPEIQEKIYKEVMEFCGDREIYLEDVSNFTYLEMVIKEALRHFAVPFIMREAATDLKINDDFTVPAGIRTMIVTYNLHHDHKYWEKPGEFYPEHFLPNKVLNRPKGVFIPFSNGPRNCPGNRYAMMSMKMLVSTVVKRFEFTTPIKPPKDFSDWHYRTVFMLWPASGFQVQMKSRDLNFLKPDQP